MQEIILKIRYFVSYLEKEKRYDIETFSSDRVLNHAENAEQNLVPDSILVNNPKQPLHVKNSFINKIC